MKRFALALLLALSATPAYAAVDVSFENDGGGRYLKDHGERLCRIEKTGGGWTLYSLGVKREIGQVERDPNGGFVVIGLDGQRHTASGNIDDEAEVGFAIATFIDRGVLATAPLPMPMPVPATPAPARTAPPAEVASGGRVTPVMRGGMQIGAITPFEGGAAAVLDAGGREIGVVMDLGGDWAVRAADGHLVTRVPHTNLADLAQGIAAHFADFASQASKPVERPTTRAGAKRTVSGFYSSKNPTGWDIVHDGRTVGYVDRKGANWRVTDVRGRTLGTAKPSSRGWDVFDARGNQLGDVTSNGFMHDTEGKTASLRNPKENFPDFAAWFFFSVMDLP